MKLFTILFLVIHLFSCKKVNEKQLKKIKTELPKNIVATITPINHATAIIEFDDVIIYLDPTGGKESFTSFKSPTYILITDIHGDHMNIKTLEALHLLETKIIAPKAVIERLSNIKCKGFITINNNEEKIFDKYKIKAVPMYNLRKEAKHFHKKGRGNGYVLTIGKERIYFSGDTEDIPEMRNLKNIDKAFVCMNLPYTMTVDKAAEAVLEFTPKQVYPYHYRGTNGLSDVEKFKKLVQQKNKNIEVIQLDWYPKK